MKSKIAKLVVLFLFLAILALASWYMWQNFVLKSPYYQQENDAVERTD